MRLAMRVVVLCVCALSMMAAPIHAQEGAVVVPTGERQLFLDDYIVAEINNLTHAMHQPDKKGAVIRPDWSIMGERTKQLRSAPVWNSEREIFQMWDLYGNEPPSPYSDVSGYYESKDGLNWSKPIVGQIEFRGSTENNYVSVMIDGKRHGPGGWLVYDPTDPDPARRYKGLAKTSRGWQPFVFDGMTTGAALAVPPIPGSGDIHLSFDEREHLFIATPYIYAAPYGRSVGLSVSRDFEDWTAPELIFQADKLDQELGRENIKARLADSMLAQPVYNDPAEYIVNLYNMRIFRYEGLYIGLPSMMHWTGIVPTTGLATGFSLVQLACSRDLHNWTRLGDRQPFIAPSRLDSGAYDLTQIIPPGNPVVRGEELWFYYTGLKYRHIPNGADPDQAAICLAVLRRDGFISLDAGEEAGSIITKSLRIPEGAQRLFVNVDAPNGDLRAVILNTSGQPLEDFAIDKCVPVTGNQPHAEVTWEGNPDLSALAGQDIQLRFRLRNASFYSFWFE